MRPADLMEITMSLFAEETAFSIFTNRTSEGWRWTLAVRGQLVASPRSAAYPTEAEAMAAARAAAALYASPRSPDLASWRVV